MRSPQCENSNRLPNIVDSGPSLSSSLFRGHVGWLIAIGQASLTSHYVNSVVVRDVYIATWVDYSLFFLIISVQTGERLTINCSSAWRSGDSDPPRDSVVKQFSLNHCHLVVTEQTEMRFTYVQRENGDGQKGTCFFPATLPRKRRERSDRRWISFHWPPLPANV